jgi:hypothetical protein
MNNRKIREQRRYVAQLEAALKFYVSEAEGGHGENYGDLGRLIRTAQDYVYVEQGKLNQMEAGR